MKKQLIIGVLAILVLVVLGWVLVGKTTPEKKISGLDWRNSAEWLPKTGGATTTEELVEPLAPLDYSKLTGKDRLYTEKEGKYENLSDAEKNLLRTVLTLPECIGKPKKVCSDNEWEIMHSSILSLNNRLLLFNGNNTKGAMSYEFYDLAQKKIVSKPIAHYPCIRNDDLVICVDNSNHKVQNLIYYRLGMSTFAQIPKSTLHFDESYLYHVGMDFMDSKGEISDSTLKISIFREQPEVVSSLWPKLREVTFDLNTLP